MTTSIEDLNYKPCEKLDGTCVEAYVELSDNLDATDGKATEIKLTSTWGESVLDIEPQIKAGETITHLFLSPEDNPTALQYNREDYGREGAENAGVDCIEGDDLSRIISMQYLKDVSQEASPSAGDIYVYGDDNLFHLFAFNDWKTLVDGNISNLQEQVTNLQQTVENLEDRIEVLENLLKKPADLPDNVSVAWSNINLYSDHTDTNLRTSGIYGHTTKADWENDEYFS